MSKRRRNLFALILCLGAGNALVCTAAAPVPPSVSTRYAPPEAVFSGGNQLQLLQDEINQKQLSAAATRVDALLRDSADLLIEQDEEGSAVSVATWIANLPNETKDLLRPASEAGVGAAAQQAVLELEARPDADPSDFDAIARRYPLTHAAAAALAEGARRNALLGDVPAARWMLDAAAVNGWLPDAALVHAVQPSTPPPNFYCGSLPFQASWYGLPTRQAWAALRSFPTAAGDSIFVVGPAQVIALKENGAVLWKGPPAASPGAGRGAAAPMGSTRGPAFAPAMLCDASGDAQLLIVREPYAHGDGWALRALRASDGRLLWSTEGQDDYRGLVFGSNAAVEGRYVYAVAGEVADEVDKLWIVAIEATTGRQLWRCDIGSESRTLQPVAPGPGHKSIYRPWMNESEPIAAGDLLVASPDVGAVIAVGRFDGKLRWTRSYPTLADPSLTLQRQRDWAMEHPSANPLLATGVSLRWNNTPALSGDVVISAPQDSNQVLAMNASDGKIRWQSSDFSTSTLWGIAGRFAILAGQGVAAVDLSSGNIAWSYTDQPIVGPGVVRDDLLLAPTAAGIVTLSTKNGSTVALALPNSAQRPPNFAAVIATESAHDVLVQNDVAHCFAASPKP